MSKIIGIDLGTTNSVVAVMEGGDPTVITTAEGSRLLPVGGGLQQERRAPGRPDRQAPGGGQPREHRLFDQALHGPPLRRSGSRAQDGSLPGGAAAPPGMRASRSRMTNREYTPQEISAMILGKLKSGRRSLPGRAGHPGGDHRPGLLQRQPAPGHQGRRQDRRAGSAAHHQRAHRRRPGLRAG